MEENWEKYRERIIGLGEHSARKSYYPELQEKIEQLEYSQHNLETIINSISDGIVLHNSKGNIISLNSQAQEIFNIPGSDISKYTIMDISSGRMNTNDLFPIWEEVLKGKPKIIEWTICKIGTQEEVPVHVSINKAIWENKPALVSVVRDFSERKKYEQELIIARQKAEESDKLKSAFLANLSHEIRTPMNAILGFSDLLHLPDLSQEIRDQYVNIIHERGNHLLGIINDIIEMSKIETGQTNSHLGVVNLDTWLNNIYNSIKITIPLKKDIELRLICSLSALSIISDEVKLTQIISNLITNAIKYTEKGHVEFGYNILRGNKVEFFVTDTGPGIDKKYHSMIFDRFNRIESDLTIKVGGSGIGLAISKAYGEMLGGSFLVESEPGKGSTFKFILPYTLPVNKNTSKISNPSVEELPDIEDSILIAEDDDFSYLYLENILPKSKFKIQRAKNGIEAVEICKNTNVTLVLMDIKMPKMDGYDALKLIKGFKPNLVIIAQTAFASPDDKVSIKQAGFDGYITKPIKKEQLFEIIKSKAT